MDGNVELGVQVDDEKDTIIGNATHASPPTFRL